MGQHTKGAEAGDLGERGGPEHDGGGREARGRGGGLSVCHAGSERDGVGD